MSDFRTKLLGFAAIGMAMTGISYGQTVICGSAGAPAGNIISNVTLTATQRVEAQTELVQDLITTGTGCATTTLGAPSTTQGYVFAVLNAQPTSKLTGAVPGQTDAALVIQNTSVAPNTFTTYLGSISGSSIVFGTASTPVIFPATFQFQIANMRVNASTATSLPFVTAYANIEYNSAQSVTNEANLISAATQVGYIQPSLSVSLFNLNGGTPVITSNSYLTCIGNPLPLIPGGNLIVNPIVAGFTNTSFQLTIKELTPGAFKLQQGTSPFFPAIGPGIAGENGDYEPGGVIGTANGPTQIALTLANIPASATVYLPFTLSAGAPATTLTLVGFGNALTSPASVAGLNVQSFTPNSSGVIVATYAVTAAPVTTALTFQAPIEVVFAANAAAVQGPMTVTAAYAPSAAPLTGASSVVPTFAVSTATPLNASVVSSCLTTLLFPYVTNFQGTYETGIALVNTTTDNLGVKGASAATPINGTCTIWFYGNQAQPTAVVTPTLGAFSTAAGSPVPYYANTLSAMTGLTNFTGYAIAQCNFPEAHGFALVTDYQNTTGAFSDAYLGLVIPNLRGEGIGIGH
jgi:hypothetical protein